MIPMRTGHDGPTAAVFIRHRNMEPCIRYGSIAFLADPGFAGEGIYSMSYEGRHLGDLRRVTFAGKRWRLSMDNWPDHGTRDYVADDEMSDFDMRQVIGAAMPFTSEFGDFLQQRLLSAEGLI